MLDALASRCFLTKHQTRTEAHYIVLPFCSSARNLQARTVLEAYIPLFNNFLSAWKAFTSYRAGANSFLRFYALNFPNGYGRVGFKKGLSENRPCD